MAKTLTKRELVNKISAETNFTQIEVFDIVQRAVDIISSTLAEGDRVVIRNFGTFQAVSYTHLPCAPFPSPAPPGNGGPRC